MANVEVSYIFPVHNEASVLISQLTHFLRLVFSLKRHNFEIILVENGSSDHSKLLTEQLAAKYTFFSTLSLANPSYGSAIKHGLLAAKGNKLFVLNVDYFDKPFVEKALGLLEYVEIVIGSKTLSKSNDQRSPLRRLSTYFFNVLLRLVLNYPGTDTHGIKAFRKSATLFEALARCRTQNELFDTELVLRMTHNGALFVDLPQDVYEVRPTRYAGMRRIKSTLYDLWIAVKSKYVDRHDQSYSLVDADDYGISDQVNQAILQEARADVVRVISILPNLVTPKAIKQLKKLPRSVTFSLHFNLLRGKPCANKGDVRSLVDQDGSFFPLPLFFIRLLLGLIKTKDIETEFKAQYAKLRAYGIAPQGVNSEQHLHVFPPLSQLIENKCQHTTIRNIRSLSSTIQYLRHKPFRFAVFNCLLLLCTARFGWYGEFKKNYTAKIVHPGTHFDY